MNSDKTIIIAEAGVNHNGDYGKAVEMVYAAKEAGADYVKFQTAVPELVNNRRRPPEKERASWICAARYTLNLTLTPGLPGCAVRWE